jgi:HK97 family phage major capsid protein
LQKNNNTILGGWISMELKDLQNQLQTSFDELKKMGQRQEDEIKKFGDVTQETKNSITTINEEMTKLKGQIDDLATKANRIAVPGQGSNDPKEQEKKSAFFKFMREGFGGLNREEKALVQDAAGEILVPEALDSVLYRELPKLNILRSLANVRQISTNRVRRRSITELTTGWGKLETTAAKLGDFESTPVPSDDYIYVEDALGLVKIGEDELEDTDINLTQFLADSFARAYAEMEEKAFMVGTGHANNQPEGILNGTVVGRFNTGAVATFTADDAVKLAYQVAAQYRQKGVYVANSQIELAMRLMKDSNGQYLWQPSLQAGTPATFNGRPVYNNEDVSGTVATGNNILVFGDVNASYQIVDRTGSTIQRLNELYIEDGLIGFKFKRRVGGGIVRPNALKVLKVQ